MSFGGFLFRIISILLITWIIGSIIGSFWWGLYFAVAPVILYKMMRPR